MKTGGRYRPDIDGLRAVAVVPVVLFHAGFETFSGGFVGVDVFFVISGYLITDLLYREAERTGRINIAQFYERRVRRIFPALLFLIAVVLAAGYLLLLPPSLSNLAESSIAATLFVSNIYFYLNQGYFAAAESTSPLLHTWSLAVEEQFYIFWPLVIWAIVRFARTYVLHITCAIVAASLALSAISVFFVPSATFYLLPTRAWELLAGAILVFVPRLAKGNETLAFLGLALNMVPVLLYDEAMSFPGLAAVPPVLGAALVIYAAEGTRAGRWLSLSPFRGVGLISYSFYLWHWPIIVFGRELFAYDLTGAIVAIALSLALATLSWRYVERPFRRSAAPTPFRPLLAGAAGIAVCCLVSIVLLSGRPERLPDNVQALLTVKDEANYEEFRCFSIDNLELPNDCLTGVETVLWGDSHGGPYADLLAKQLGSRFAYVGGAGCAPIIGDTPRRHGREVSGCRELNEAILDELIRSDVSSVILVGRWSRFYFPDGHPEAQRLSTDVVTSLEDLLPRLDGRQVTLVGSGPEFVSPLPECLAYFAWHEFSDPVCEMNPATLPEAQATRDIESLVSRHPQIEYVSAAKVLCPDGCIFLVEGRPILRDSDHMSSDAAAVVLRRLDGE